MSRVVEHCSRSWRQKLDKPVFRRWKGWTDVAHIGVSRVSASGIRKWVTATENVVLLFCATYSQNLVLKGALYRPTWNATSLLCFCYLSPTTSVTSHCRRCQLFSTTSYYQLGVSSKAARCQMSHCSCRRQTLFRTADRFITAHAGRFGVNTKMISGSGRSSSSSESRSTGTVSLVLTMTATSPSTSLPKTNIVFTRSWKYTFSNT